MIRKYSGTWLTERAIDAFEPRTAAQLEQLKSDPQRTVVFPSEAEIVIAKAAFRAVRDEWADASPHHRQLLNAAEAEISRYRSEH